MTSGNGYNPTGAQVLAALATASDHLPNLADYTFTTSASATIGLGSVMNATIITGGTATSGATVTNAAAAGANNLNYTLGAAVQSGSATLGSFAPGSSGSLAPSASQTCTVSVASTAIGVNMIAFTASDPNSTNLAQTTTATLTVLGHAAGSLTVTSGNGFLVHAGATGLSATISVGNAAGMLSGLEVNSAPSVSSGALSSGPATPYYVSAGSAQTYTATFNAGNTSGVLSNSVSFASVGDNQALPGANPLGSLSVSVTGNVYSGQAQWNAASGSWAASGNWTDAIGGGPSGPPGISGFFTDTATFGTAIGSGSVAVTLDSAAPVLSSLVFSSSNTSYVILQGTGSMALTLTGTGGDSPAAVTVISGTHSVEAPILLGSNAAVTMYDPASSLSLNGGVSGMGGLTLSGSGTLILAGNDTYLGGTIVGGGNLYAENANALSVGSSLAVGSGATSLFGTFAMPVVPETEGQPGAVTVSPVPEPGTLAIVLTGAICCLAGRKWRRFRATSLSENP
jgi:hypothetical protein